MIPAASHPLLPRQFPPFPSFSTHYPCNLADQLTPCINHFTPVFSAGYNGASDFFIDTNVQLAVSAARELHAGTGKRTHILLPDETEYLRAAKL